MADNCRVFDGSDDQISDTLPTGVVAKAAYSIGMWVKLDGYGDDGRGLLKAGPANALTRGFLIQVDNSGHILWRASGPTDPDATAVGTGSWVPIGVTSDSSGSTTSIARIISGTQVGTQTMDSPTELSTGDVVAVGPGHSPFGVGFLDGSVAWAFWLQGVTLSASALNGYLNDPESLYDDYGPSGTVTADALKIFWPMQCDDGSTETDVSGVGNDGTITGATLGSGTGPSPTTAWDPCGGDVTAYYVVTELTISPTVG